MIGLITFIIGMSGGCKGINPHNTNGSLTANKVVHTTEKENETGDAEKKGCLSCHEGIEVISDRMQPFLLSFARQKYKKGSATNAQSATKGNPHPVKRKKLTEDSFQTRRVCGYSMREKVAQNAMTVKEVYLHSWENLSASLLEENLCRSNSFFQNLP
ncbi:hypothetical protein KSU1_C0094 [Candidatus Jettenia caeni]|uniref:Uncharacterized protein n=1 Tax=Candidatus Jettenia caeni TaxID=247490 RepID=I3IIZ5_9BACT|nr:hypothetical protein KSU1_C0094 [Candidatus Jettenia caeni]